MYTTTDYTWFDVPICFPQLFKNVFIFYIRFIFHNLVSFWNKVQSFKIKLRLSLPIWNILRSTMLKINRFLLEYKCCKRIFFCFIFSTAPRATKYSIYLCIHLCINLLRISNLVDAEKAEENSVIFSKSSRNVSPVGTHSSRNSVIQRRRFEES